MKGKTLITGLILLTFTGCSDDNFDVHDFRDDPSIKTLNGTWKVISFEDFIQHQVEFKNQENSWGHDIIVTFDDNQNPHEFSGKNTTNLGFGEFDNIDSRAFKLRRLGTSFAGQPEWADQFSQAVCGNGVSFKISSTRLRLYYDNRTKSVTLDRE